VGVKAGLWLLLLRVWSWVLAGSRWYGSIEVYEVVCGLGEVVDLQGVGDWGSGSWFEGFRVVYVAMGSKAGMCILVC